MTEISLIIPAYNEENIIKHTVFYAKEFLKMYFKNYEIIVVDDGSLDGTAEAARSGGDIILISYKPNRGKGYAIRQGVLKAQGKYILFMDADMAYRFDYILCAVDLLQEADVVIGSRYIDLENDNPYPLYRRFLSRGFVSIVNKALHMDFTDTQCGFKAFRSAAAKKIFGLTRVNDFSFDVELLYIAKQLGYKITELPVSMQVFDRCTKVKMFSDSAKMFKQVMHIKKHQNDTFERLH